MIKTIKKYSMIFSLILMSSCQLATLTDQSINKYIVMATKGDFAAKVDVSWQNTDYYSYYEVLRSESSDGNYSVVSDKISTDLFSDCGVSAGKLYYYKVRGYNSVGTPMYVSDVALGYAGAEGGFYPPDLVTANIGESTKTITLSWTRANNATEYSVNKSDSIDGRYEEIYRTTRLEYIDSDVVTGKTYYYRITSYDSDGGPSANSSTSIGASVFGANLNLTTEPNSKTVKLTWTPYELATMYAIYKSEDQHLMGDIVSTIDYQTKSISEGGDDSMEFSDSDVESGKSYYYTILYKNDVVSSKSETIRGFLQQDTAPDKPVITSVSEGTHTDDITIKWDSVDGATEYEVSRAISASGPWTMLDPTEYTTFVDKNVPENSSSYYYRVVAFDNGTPGENSDAVLGWVNRAPLNISASKDYSTKVVLTWDEVVGADVYMVTFSVGGDFQPAAGESIKNSDGTVTFEHKYDIGVEETKNIYYKVQVRAGGNLSSPSDSVVGKIQKMTPPTNLRVTSNKTKTKSMRILWDEVAGARKYMIYRVVLKHHNTDPSTITPEDFSYFGESDNAAFDLSFTYPIRRHQYMVFAVDGEGVTGAASITDTVYRLPVDIEDLVQDVDFTINQAQRQINNFGGFGSSGNISGRFNGLYVYSAGLSSKNDWQYYGSYEIILDGEQTLTTSIATASAKMNGDLNVTGLYNGKITYNALDSKEGGIAIGGGLTITYDGVSEYWGYQKAATIMEALLLSSSDPSPRDPNNPNSEIYTEVGYGDDYK